MYCIYVLYILYIYIYREREIQQWPTLNLDSFNGWKRLLNILRQIVKRFYIFLVKTERKERNVSRFLIELLIRIL